MEHFYILVTSSFQTVEHSDHRGLLDRNGSKTETKEMSDRAWNDFKCLVLHTEQCAHEIHSIKIYYTYVLIQHARCHFQRVTRDVWKEGNNIFGNIVFINSVNFCNNVSANACSLQKLN